MPTTTVRLEPETLPELARSLASAFPKAFTKDIKIQSVDETRMRIETPVKRLGHYHFAASFTDCSWTTKEASIVLELKHFVVAQRTEKNIFCLEVTKPSPLEAIVFELTRGAPSQVRDIFLTRSLRAIDGLKSLDEENLIEAIKAPTDYSVLVAALNHEETLAPVRDPLAGARLRGLDAKRSLLESEGGSITSAEAAGMLKITRQAIDKRRNEGKLLAVELGRKGYHYPSWQFDLEGLEDVLSALGDRDFWEKLSFFLNPSSLLADRTPLEVLRKGKGQVELVVRAARSHGEHGG